MSLTAGRLEIISHGW